MENPSHSCTRYPESFPDFGDDVVFDYFGPYTIKDGCKEIKLYGCIFTCLASRAIHLEPAVSLEMDSFIHALRRFIARRGHVIRMFSDNGTNFVGAERELFSNISQEQIK